MQARHGKQLNEIYKNILELSNEMRLSKSYQEAISAGAIGHGDGIEDIQRRLRNIMKQVSYVTGRSRRRRNRLEIEETSKYVTGRSRRRRDRLEREERSSS